jgi:uncharacterized protein involved in type VI secretion and phage assembly
MATTERILADLVTRVESRFLSKYRGTVVDNRDPEQLGRLRLRVPSVLGRDVVTGWALPCAPYGGDAGQGLLFVPEIGAGVWVEFEEGDLEFPIWVGTYWSKPGHQNEMPKPNRADGSEELGPQPRPTRKIVKTVKGHTLQFEDADGAEMVTIVEATHKHVITLDGTGIRVKDGRSGHEIALGPEGISVSDGLNAGNSVTTDASGVTIADKNGNEVILGPRGIQIGGKTAEEAIVLGTSLKANIVEFMANFNKHTHVGNMGAVTSPPVPPLKLDVPLSKKHRVE